VKFSSHVAANLATTIACALLSAVLIQQLQRGSAGANRSTAPAVYASGETIEGFPELAATEGSTVVLYLSSTCRFCNQSVPFYRELSRVRTIERFRIVAIGREPAPSLKSYLALHEIDVDQVLSVGTRSLKMTATPTLLIVDSSSRVLDSWVGLLGGREAEVHAALKQGR
jgi:hypothetical protein